MGKLKYYSKLNRASQSQNKETGGHFFKRETAWLIRSDPPATYPSGRHRLQTDSIKH